MYFCGSTHSEYPKVCCLNLVCSKNASWKLMYAVCGLGLLTGLSVSHVQKMRMNEKLVVDVL